MARPKKEDELDPLLDPPGHRERIEAHRQRVQAELAQLKEERDETLRKMPRIKYKKPKNKQYHIRKHFIKMEKASKYIRKPAPLKLLPIPDKKLIADLKKKQEERRQYDIKRKELEARAVLKKEQNGGRILSNTLVKKINELNRMSRNPGVAKVKSHS